MARRPVRPRRRSAAAVALGAVLLAMTGLVGCGGGEDAGSGAPRPDEPAVVRVGPDREHATIQAGVDAARPGDLVLIDPGTYREAVAVTTPELVIRGLDRNAVVLDGGGELLNGFEVTADQVAIENLTVRRYAVNGVLFTAGYGGDDPQSGPVGWRASYVTAAGNGLYGLYAFGTGPGQFDHNYASGHPDSGIYVGQCQDCGAVVVDNVAEHNAVGYENTNAGGVVVAGNTFRSNRVGVIMASADTEELAPQDGGQVVANLIVDNDAPGTPETSGGFGVGIVLAGGTGNEVRGNEIRGHPGAGIVVIDQDGYAPAENRITGNRLADNALDLLLAREDGGVPEAPGTCFADNRPAATRPPELESLLPCDGEPAALPASALALPDGPPGVGAADVPDPPDQPGMPDADEETWSAPTREPPAIDLDAIEVPDP